MRYPSLKPPEMENLGLSFFPEVSQHLRDSGAGGRCVLAAGRVQIQPPQPWALRGKTSKRLFPFCHKPTWITTLL